MTMVRRLALVLLVPLTAASAQSPADFSKAKSSSDPALLVVWSAPGAIRLPPGDGWKFESLAAYDHANRPAALYKNESLQAYASFIVSKNLSGKPNAEGCRSDVIDGLLKQFHATISQRVDAQSTGANGHAYPSTSYLRALPNSGVNQRNTFAFAGNAETCTEIHVSTIEQGAAGESALRTALTEFSPELEHKTTPAELFAVGGMLLAVPLSLPTRSSAKRWSGHRLRLRPSPTAASPPINCLRRCSRAIDLT